MVKTFDRLPRVWLRTLVWAAALLAALALTHGAAHADGPLTVELYTSSGEPLNAYNLVVASSISSSYAPAAATVIGRFCNSSLTQTITGVIGYIGDYKTSPAGSTPGLYPSRDSSQAAFQAEHPALANTGSYAFAHMGGSLGAGDAARYIGDLAPGTCRVQYWHFSYPQCANSETPPCSGVPTWGDAAQPADDLRLEFDVWATGVYAPGGGTALTSDDETWTMRMRSEVGAMANKIVPNPNGRWFNTGTAQPGDVITSTGLLFELGPVKGGFDNDGDFVPDYNAWLQPVGDAAYDPTCFRLIRTSAYVTVSRDARPDMVIHVTDRLYLTHLPPDNTGVVGHVDYTFLALNGPCAAGLTPYQEVASGRDNERFNGDYGAGIPPLASLSPKVAMNKRGTVLATPGSSISYTVDLANAGSRPAGLPMYGMGLVVSDAIPAGTALSSVPASDVGVQVLYSTDGGQGFSAAPPANLGTVTHLQTWLSTPLAASAAARLAFTVTVDASFPPAGTPPFIENCAEASLGAATPFAQDCAGTMVQGSYRLGDRVWNDTDSDGVQDGGESGLGSIGLSLYWDKDGGGQLDSRDLFLATTTTSITGWYTFNQLPAGDYIILAEEDDPDLPTGYRHTADVVYAVTLSATHTLDGSADFGYGPSLGLSKVMERGGGYEGQLATYTIMVRNLRPGVGEIVAGGAYCRYTAWAGQVNSASDVPPSGTGNSAWQNVYNVLSNPDESYAVTRLENASDLLGLRGFNFLPYPGDIISVEVQLYAQEIKHMKSDNNLGVSLYVSNASTTTRQYDGSTDFIGDPGDEYLFTWDVSALYDWTWAHFANDTTELQLTGSKGAGSDPGNVGLDAVAFRVIVDEPCPVKDPYDAIATAPLTDTYDTALLQFVSASPPQSSIDTAAGVITWTDVGPIYPGDGKNINVTFLALEPNPEQPTTAYNTAGVEGAAFSDGRPTNAKVVAASGVITPTGTISGVVWSDVDADGWQGTLGYESGEPFVPLVTVTLYVCDGITSQDANKTCTGNGGTWTPLATHVTTASGRYLFEALPNGYYYVGVDPSRVPGIGSNPQTGDPDDQGRKCTYGGGNATCDNQWQSTSTKLSGLVRLDYATNEHVRNINFGYDLQAALYGEIWQDLDGDGTHDAGEGGLDNGAAGVTIALLNCGADLVCGNGDDSAAGTTSTDAAGYYRFTALTFTRTYRITVSAGTLPPGSTWSITSESGPGTVGTLDGVMASVTLVDGQISGAYDFGYHRAAAADPYTIGDTVYADWDGDGVQDEGEEGVAGITLTLYLDSDGDGAFTPASDASVTATRASANGVYTFTGLVTGTYLVVVDESGLPAWWDDGQQTQDPDEAGICSLCNGWGVATVSALAKIVQDIDFGYKPLGFSTIGDTVWLDTNRNGIQDVGESGIPSVTVRLYRDYDKDGVPDPADAPVMTRTTDANGYYLFSDLFTNLPSVTGTAGAYLVIVDTGDPDFPRDAYGNPYVSTVGGDWITTTLDSGQHDLGADFGYVSPGQVGDALWQDNDGDGLQDAGEPGLSSVTVALYTWIDGDHDGVYSALTDTASLVTTGATDASGLYLFPGLGAGQYVVKVLTGTLPATLTIQAADPDRLNVCGDTSLPGDPPCDASLGVTLLVGQRFMQADFGFRPARSLGDRVWLDADGDGAQDVGEPGIGGVIVTLTRPAGGALTTTTDLDGYYSFGGGDLNADGAYVVQVNTSSLPSAQMTQTFDYDQPGGSCSVCDHQAMLAIGGGGLVTDAVDFGYRYDGSYTLGGHVFFDGGGVGDGLIDAYAGSPLDMPYGGIILYLWDSLGNPLGATATGADGVFTFTHLAGGGLRYTVSLDPASPQLLGMSLTASPNAGLTYNTVTITTAHVANQDFGFFALMDCGDLPGSYNTGRLDEGPCHVNTSGALSPTHYLGSRWDGETDGFSNSWATGDDGNQPGNDEDGFNLGSGVDWRPGNTIVITLTRVTGGNAYLAGWFDWNGDGDFAAASGYDPGEYQYFGHVPAGVDIPLNVTIPASSGCCANRKVNMRFRLYRGSSPPPVIAPTGNVVDGEVEDHQKDIPTAVDLADFRAVVVSRTVLLEWETATELDNLGFNLYRADSPDGLRARLNDGLIPAQEPGSVWGAVYQFVDRTVQEDATYAYWLEDVDIYGIATLHGPIVVTVGEEPTAVELCSFTAAPHRSPVLWLAACVAAGWLAFANLGERFTLGTDSTLWSRGFSRRNRLHAQIQGI